MTQHDEIAYDLHTVHTTILLKRKNNAYQQHSNNIHQLYNIFPVSEKPFYTSNGWGI